MDRNPGKEKKSAPIKKDEKHEENQQEPPKVAGKEKQSAPIKKVRNHQENQQECPRKVAGSSQTLDLSDGKFLVKLKIRKSAEEGEFARSPVENNHVCQVCYKQFTSGKALGGHMSSAHVQAKDHNRKLKLNKSTKFKMDGSGSHAVSSSRNPKETVCQICGKGFPSRKSLFGHMRCHPEREWRGMEPPKDPNKILPYDDDDYYYEDNDDDYDDTDDYFDGESQQTDHQINLAARVMVSSAVDLTKSLSSWVVKGTRGREGLKSSRGEPLADEEEKNLYDAVEHLISLGNGNPNDHTEEQEIIQDEVIIDDSSTPSADIKDVNNGFGSRRQNVEVNPGRDRRDFPKKRKFSATASDDSEETLDGVSSLGQGKASIRQDFSDEKSSSGQSKNIGLPRGSDNNKNFFADNGLKCVKTQPENHKMVLVKNRRREQKAKPMSSRIEGAITPVNQKMDASMEVTPEKFKCSTCDKCFSTHQALGGHRSSHNKLRISIQNVADEYSSPTYQKKESSPPGHEIHANNSSPQILGSKESKVIDGSEAAENIHECKTCKKTFPTGQALGGHKRSHWQGSSNQVEAQEQEGENRNSTKKFLNFDLNLYPQQNEDDDDDVND